MERETKIKLIFSGIFLILVLSVVFLIYHSNKAKEDLFIESVRIAGYNLLSENDYLSFTKLSGLQESNELSLPVIKSRFEKHPYILKADVKLVNDKEVKVFLTEKRIYGVIIINGEALFAAENFEMLPVFPNTKMIDIPVLSNIKGANELKPLKRFNSEDIIHAYKIIEAAGLTNDKMLKDLAEINLRNGGDIVLSFSGLSMPVIFGRNYEARKMVSLEAVLNNFLIVNTESDYIDLRFYNDIYIGHTQRVEL